MYEVIYPNSEILKKHIVSFNILKKDIELKDTSYFAFPQMGITIGYWQNTLSEIDGHDLSFSSSSKPLHCILLGKYLNPLKLTYQEYVEEVSINFTTTGINYFFDNYFVEFAAKPIQLLDDNFTLPNGLFSGTNESRINNLEAHLLQLYRQINIEQVEKAVEMIKSQPNIMMKELAKKVFLTEKTLNRRFKRYVGCTPADFRKICKFRNTIRDKFESGRSKNLTQLGIDNHYYDSPHFYKEINKIANFNPSEFFNNVSSVGKDAYPYIFS